MIGVYRKGRVAEMGLSERNLRVTVRLTIRRMVQAERWLLKEFWKIFGKY